MDGKGIQDLKLNKLRAQIKPASLRRVQLFPAVFQTLRHIDTDAFIREGPEYGGGLYKMEPKEYKR